MYAGRWAALRPLKEGSDDVERLYSLLSPMSDDQVVHLQGSTPSLEQFQRQLWMGVYAQWVICSVSDPTALGLASLTSVDLRNGYGFFSVAVDQTVPRLAFGAEATGLALQYIFETFPLRVLLFDVTEDVFERRFKSGAGKYFDVDGCRRQLVFAGGRYVDVYLLSLSRERWLSYGPKLLQRIRGRNG